MNNFLFFHNSKMADHCHFEIGYKLFNEMWNNFNILPKNKYNL